jgi:hypothetical protein
VNSLLTRKKEKQLAKKKANLSGNFISKFFDAKDSFKKDDVQQKEFLEDLVLLIMKNHLPIQFVENVWFKHLALHLCSRINFPSKRPFSHDILPSLVEKTKQVYVLLVLAKHYFVIVSFDFGSPKRHMMCLHSLLIF